MWNNSVRRKRDQLGYIALIVILPLFNFNKAIAEEIPSIFSNEYGDGKGVFTTNFSWGAPKLPYKHVADIKDELTHKLLGKVVPDRDGVGSENVYGPFYSPEYGDFVYVSFWESTKEGCFVELVTQKSDRSNQFNSGNYMVPKLLEIGIGESSISLLPEKLSEENSIKFQPQSFAYIPTNLVTPQVGIWYMTHTRFRINKNNADFLSNAPNKKATIRLTLTTDQTKIFTIGLRTVEKWKEVFNFNPECKNLSKK